MIKANGYARYAPYIQKFIYDQHWDDLKDIQNMAAGAILDRPEHVLITGDTASGKTEAAFFPILTWLEDAIPRKGAAVLYISPLKALINDQNERLRMVLKAKDNLVIPWHGDISASVKKRLENACNAIVQITPESLEAMLMRKPKQVQDLFGGVRFIVIDEIHSFIADERGSHLLCLLTRLQRIIGHIPRRIALSATISDLSQAAQYLKAGTDARVIVCKGQSGKDRKIQLAVADFETEDLLPGLNGPATAFLYRQVVKGKSLIFCSSREESEKVILSLKDLAAQYHQPDIFYVHHGSLSAATRKETEDAFKGTAENVAAAATMTLELGIDIGDLSRIVQVGPPNSVSSFVQRLGRSGRRTGISRMLFITRTKEGEENVIHTISWHMLQVMAIIELYLKEKWIEDFSPRPKPYSLLVHQTLAILYQKHELKPNELASQVLSLPPFQTAITPAAYKKLLRHLLENEYLLQLESGSLIVGSKAEPLVNFHTFFAVFKDNVMFKVLHDATEIGTIDNPVEVGDIFILAARSWIVKEVDEHNRVVKVEPAKGRNVLSWSGGGIEIHGRIYEKMKELLLGEEVPAYLPAASAAHLQRSRQLAKRIHLDQYNLFTTTEGQLVYIPFVSSRILKTIVRLFNNGLKNPLKIQYVINHHTWLVISTQLEPEEFYTGLQVLLSMDFIGSDALFTHQGIPIVDKFDELLPASMLQESYVANQLDLPGALAALKDMSW